MSYYPELEKEYAELRQELADMTAEKERCRLLAVDWSLKADGYKASLEMCQNMKLAHEFEDLLQTTSIPIAVEKVRGMIEVMEAAEELRCGQQGTYQTCRLLHCQWHGSSDCDCEKIFQALAQIKETKSDD